jgi:hypothetical protein
LLAAFPVSAAAWQLGSHDLLVSARGIRIEALATTPLPISPRPLAERFQRRRAYVPAVRAFGRWSWLGTGYFRV